MKKILLLHDKDDALLGIGFALQCARYSPVPFCEPEELVNWAKIYRASLCGAVLLYNCRDAALVERLQRLISSCNLDLQILVVADRLPRGDADAAVSPPRIRCCRPENLAAELGKLQQSESRTDANRP